MDFKSFHYALAIADKGSISGAAKILGISQPSLSKYLQNLQDTLGIQLFERKNGRLIPTHAGKRYLEAGGKILDMEKQLFPQKVKPEKSQTCSANGFAIDFKHLYYISAVAREKNISRVAEKLYIAQSALSQTIIKMEERIGTAIFNRLRYGISLTLEGRYFVHISDQMLDIKKELDNDLRFITNGHEGKIQFGISHTFSDSLLPQALSDFHWDHPHVEIIVHTETSAVLKLMLLDFSLDAAVMVESGKKDPRLSYEVLFYEQILLAISPENPIVEQGIQKEKGEYPYLEPKLLHGQSFILSENNMRLRQSAETFFAAENIDPVVAVTTANIDTAENLVAHNVGIAFIPASHITKHETPKNLKYFSTAPTLSDWTISIVKTKKSKPSPLLEAFLSILKANI
jgi:DNA-binding transcriptional LysR family regulator